MILLTHERQWRGGETVVAFGMFDGVHEGHAQLMRKANELAALHDLKSVVYTFSSHPMATYAPEKVPPQLETRSEKVRSIARLGIDGVNRLRARIVVRRAEVHHKQRGLFAGFHTCEHIARHEVSPFVRGAEERNGKEQGEKRGFHKRK